MHKNKVPGGAKKNEEIIDCTQVQSEVQVWDKISLYVVNDAFSSSSISTVSVLMVRVHTGSCH